MVRRKGLLSTAASHLLDIEIDDILDLKQFHQYYNENFVTNEIPYVQYLYSFQKFPYEKSNHEGYRPYLKSLYVFLEQMYAQLYPLADSDRIHQEIDNSFDGESSQGTETIVAELYCAVCDKHFATSTVYKAHLESKKHLKRLLRLVKHQKTRRRNLMLGTNKQ